MLKRKGSARRHTTTELPRLFGFTYIKLRATELAGPDKRDFMRLWKSRSHKAPYSNHADFMTLVTDKCTHAHDESLNTFSASDIVIFCVYIEMRITGVLIAIIKLKQPANTQTIMTCLMFKFQKPPSHLSNYSMTLDKK